MAIGKDIGLNGHDVAEHAPGGKPSLIHRGTDALDDDTPAAVELRFGHSSLWCRVRAAGGRQRAEGSRVFLRSVSGLVLLLFALRPALQFDLRMVKMIESSLQVIESSLDEIESKLELIKSFLNVI
jgi:hypothetical protein